MAILTWHAEGGGPFYIFDLGARSNLNAPLRKQLEAVLLEVLLAAQNHPDTPVAEEWQDRLRWATAQFLHAPHTAALDYVKGAIGRAKSLGFEKHQPPPSAPAWLRRSWLGERRFRLNPTADASDMAD